MKMGLKVPLAMAFLFVASYANAGISALTVIPIADILGHREAVIGYNAYFNERNIDKKVYHYSYVCVGVGDFAEVAYGDSLEKEQTFHIKVKLLEGSNYMVSAGAMNMGEQSGIKADWFVAGRYDIKDLRVHFGYLKDDEERGFVGVDFPIFGNCTGMLEWVTGPGAYGWVSLNVPVKQLPGLNLWLAAGIPSDRKAQGNQSTVGVWYGFKF